MQTLWQGMGSGCCCWQAAAQMSCAFHRNGFNGACMWRWVCGKRTSKCGVNRFVQLTACAAPRARACETNVGVRRRYRVGVRHGGGGGGRNTGEGGKNGVEWIRREQQTSRILGGWDAAVSAVETTASSRGGGEELRLLQGLLRGCHSAQLSWLVHCSNDAV